MNITLQQRKETWNDFLLQNSGNFLQSFEWGSFQESLGKKVWRLAIGEGEQILLQAQIIQEKFPLDKSCLYLPFGPIFAQGLSDIQKKEAWQNLLEKIAEIAKNENAVFLLIEPTEELLQIGKRPAEKALKRIQPEQTLILDLAQTEEAIFSHFNSITRYNIRLAQRKGVTVETVEPTANNIAIFYGLLAKTSQRDKFLTYPKSYYQKLFQIFGGQISGSSAKLLMAEYQGKVVAANILVYFGDTATHLHGASDHNLRQVKAPQFLQWWQIQDAKKAGFLKYDFWGISHTKWPSLTEYKKGFGGQELSYSTGQNLIFQKNWYSLYKLTRKLLRK
jgi:peptidoglycan pentaglycine glycine transferase (the first glycine)